MKLNAAQILLIVMGLSLAGCSSMSSMLNPKSSVPSAASVPVGNSLAMPPDLQLATPTQTTENYEPNGPVEPVAATGNLNLPSKKPVQASGLYSDGPAAPAKLDLYDQYGVSKVDANGKPKKAEVLQADLKAAIIKKKREANPNYGTIANIGAIFQDQ